jgi:D-3-phosphoglycerate dehydrogenase
MKKVLYLGPAEGLDWVRSELGEDFEPLLSSPEPGAVDARLPGCAAILDASMKVPLDRARLERASELKLIATATTGADHIDGAFLQKHSIALLTLKTERDVLAQVNAAAELSWALLMACARRLGPASRHVAEGGWDRTLFPGPMLRGKTLGIVGMGRNGRWCAQYGVAFGMRILSHDPFATDWPAEVKSVDLPSLVAAADFLLVHVTYSEATRLLLSSDLVARCRPGSVWINTSRGAIWDEAALVQALESARLRAVGADVLSTEPDISRSPLWQYAQNHENVLLTPHIGGFSPDALETVIRHTARRIRHFFA